ncbi:MAG TPA: alpha-hydroxy acid oxidase [Acidimicrobiales bacterium]|nr:alpha-hydroxy acid oxidase [Acidimicrobiales bacterium]
MAAHPARPDAEPLTSLANPEVAPMGGAALGAEQVRAPVDLDLEAMEAEARRLIGDMAYAYFAGGAEDERLLGDCVAAWARWQLRPRVLTGVSEVSTATTVLGAPVATPVLVAPTAIQRLAHPDGEAAMAKGAASAGTCLVLSSLATCPLEEVAATAPDGLRWMQIYVVRERARTEELVHRAVEAGYRALVLTVDAPVSGVRLRELRGGVRLPDDLVLPNLTSGSTKEARGGGFIAVVTGEFEPALTFEDIGWLHELSGLPVVVKGVLRGDDALRCVEAGAAGVVVSNHGARQLDDAPATADVLDEVVDAVGGRAEVYVDGGIRRAPDVAKALALGARAVLVGRPTLWALATGGAEGVAGLVGWLTAELRRTMALCGASSVAELDRSLVRRTRTP